MIRINVYNLLYDARDFIRCHRGKIIGIILINILVIALGIRGAFAVYDAQTYLYNHPSNVFSFLVGKKSIFGYFLTELIACWAIIVLFAIASLHFLTAYGCILILFFRTYLFALYTCLYIIVLKLAVLPFVIVCLIPFYLAESIVFTVLIILAISQAHDARLYGFSCLRSPRRILSGTVMPCVLMTILMILHAILGYFLTLGIIL